MPKQANVGNEYNKNENKDTDNSIDKGVNKGAFKIIKDVNKGLSNNKKEEIIEKKFLKNLLYKPSAAGKTDLNKADKG